MLDGFLISAGARTQSVIAWTSCEAQYIAATATTNEVKYVHGRCGKLKRSLPPSSGRAIAAKHVRISKAPGSENVADANTKPADRLSPEFCRMNIGVTQIPKQFRDAVL